jgi:hypothetical protein
MSAFKVKCENFTPLARLVIEPTGLLMINAHMDPCKVGWLRNERYVELHGPSRAVWIDPKTGQQVPHDIVERWINPNGLCGDDHPAVKALLERYPGLDVMLGWGVS